jgi:hypothetical protein
MSSSKKINLQRDLAAGVYLPEAPSPPVTPYPPLTYCTFTCIQYTCSHREGRGGGERGNSSQSWVANSNMTDCTFSL